MSNPPFYLPRIVDQQLEKQLGRMGAVLIQGAKWCGKTTTGLHQAKSSYAMQHNRSSIFLAKNQPRIILEGETPRLIDEWQVAPSLWDDVRGLVDMRQLPGQFILTGSSTPNEQERPFHSGAGRFAKLHMRPMTLLESQDAPGGYSLAKMFAGDKQDYLPHTLELEQIFFALCRGGWPATLQRRTVDQLEMARDYVEIICDNGLSEFSDITLDSGKVRALLRSYARHLATSAPNKQIMDDVNASGIASISINTIPAYLSKLEHLFVLEQLPSWNPQLRSKAAVRSAVTRHFVDPSIACAALNIGPGDLFNDLNTAGCLFESLVVRDLRVYAAALGGDVYHYRDSAGREADAVIHLRDGRWGLVEVKLGYTQAEKAAENLVKLAADIDAATGTPAFLAVITATGDAAFTMENGVHVVPIGCLSL